MNRHDLKSKLHAVGLYISDDLVTILCDYGLELQDILKKLENAYEIVTQEESRTEKYYLLRALVESIMLDHKTEVLRLVTDLKIELEKRIE